MRKTKKLRKLWLSLVLILLVGCTSETVSGERIEINMEELAEKIRNQEDFTIVFTQSGCSSCESFLITLHDFLETHEEIIYDLNISTQTIDKEEVLIYLKPIFPDLKVTPALYDVKQGIVQSNYWEEHQDLQEGTFAKWMEEIRK